MIPEYLDLLTELHTGTVNDRVNWQKTSVEDHFVVYFQGLALGVKFVSPRNEPDNLRFTLHDSSGQVIEQFWVDQTEDEWQLAWETYSGARRRARGIDTALRTIIEELKSGKKVGSDSPPTPSSTVESDDEDVPF